MSAQASNLLLADASRPSRRKELKADVWSSLSPRALSDPIFDSPISLFSSLTTNAGPEPQGSYNLPMARLDPKNRIGTGGEDLLSNNFNWSLPLVGLGGRGLDLGLTLSYNSLVWTKSGNYVDFDVDNGSIAPGFRLGFPTVEGPYWNDQASAYFYLMVMPSGARVELRRTGSSSTYESADSVHLQLIDYGTSLLVRPTDGTQLNFVTVNYTWRCNQIKDRNGNYVSVSYNSWGDVASITDTLSRVINFNYDGYDNLISITQSWNGQTHQWATFGYDSNYYVGYNFPGLTSYGPDGSHITVLTQVGLADGSRYNFEYNNTYGQVSTVRYYAADNHQRRYTTYVYSANGSDCPRISERHDWAENWNGDYDDVPAANEEAVTQFTHDQDGACKMTASEGTAYKEYYGSAWQSGLTTQSEIWSGGVRQKWTTTEWTQDNTGVSYQTNPRVSETNVYDLSGNRRRAQIAYTSYNLPNSVALPSELKEYAANGTTVLRRTTKTYIDGQAYIDRRVLGLLREEIVYDENNQRVSKVWYDYDWGNEYWEATPQVATQHDASGDQTGRGNLCWIGRWDVTDVNNFDKSTRSYIKHNRTGSVIRAEDHYGRGNTISYADSYSDSVNRNTFAYPTTVTDADGYSSYSQFNYDFGAVTRTQGPPPAGQSQGAIQTMSYDGAGRILRVDTPYTGAYTRWDYAPYSYVSRFDTIQNGAGEQYTTTVWDGGGRVRATGGSNPGSSGGYWGKFTIYDVMGRPNQQTNPAEINGGWAPSGDDSAGWILSYQSYDWKGRPLVTTNADGTQKYASYSACGCAGSEVTTLTDEVGRQQKVYSDVLGRTAKTEVLNWDSTVYATTVNTFNARDQITQVRQYQGADTSAVYQDTTMGYDGFGRLQTKHVPEQSVGTATTYAYNADDTVYSETDARGATCTYVYNNRHQVTSATHMLSGQATIAVSYGYDAAGNRTSMNDGLGSMTYSYDQLSRLTAETRYFSSLWNSSTGGNYSISYQYNLANELTSITDPFDAQIAYTRDSVGRTTAVTGSGYANVSSYVSNIQYRAWGGVKAASYGNNRVSTTAFNNRLQPVQFRLTDASSGASYIRENYSYWGDGRLQSVADLDDTGGTNPPATLRFLSRSYGYDQAGRVADVYSSNQAPLRQNYGYDEFDNMTFRSGTVYWQPYQSATFAYTNNRHNGWSYYADGQVLSSPATTTDDAFSFYYDATGRLSRSIDTATNRTGDYRPSFDGDGKLAYEWSQTTQNGYPSPATSSYILRSTVLRGEILTRLNQNGNKSSTYVPAEGLLFATQGVDYQGSPYVGWTQRNPLGITETGKGIYDPLGNYIPFEQHNDPRPPAGSYNSSSMSGIAASMSANPFGSDTGCLMDGLPTSCSRVLRAINNGQGNKVTVYGFSTSVELSQFAASYASVTTRPSHYHLGPSHSMYIGYGPPPAGEAAVQFVITPGFQLGFEPNPQNSGAITDAERNSANSLIDKNYDRCRKLLGANDAEAPGSAGAGLALAAAQNGVDDATMIGAIWQHESGINTIDYYGDAGPAQLTGAIRNNSRLAPLVVGDAYGSWHGRLVPGKDYSFNGSVQDNVATLRNLVRFGRSEYGSNYMTAYWYGPGYTGGGTKAFQAAQAKKNRNNYANDVMRIYNKYLSFFDCLAH
jgi:YD repeat-containing protein